MYTEFTSPSEDETQQVRRVYAFSRRTSGIGWKENAQAIRQLLLPIVSVPCSTIGTVCFSKARLGVFTRGFPAPSRRHSTFSVKNFGWRDHHLRFFSKQAPNWSNKSGAVESARADTQRVAVPMGDGFSAAYPVQSSHGVCLRPSRRIVPLLV